MSCYSIPAMSMENEFANLTWLAKYVDGLVEKTGDLDYSIVYEWDDDGPNGWPPTAVLVRLDGRWWRRPVLVTTTQDREGICKFYLAVADANGH